MKTINLRIWLPLLIFAFTSSMIIGLFFHHSHEHKLNLFKQSQSFIQFNMARLQRLLESATETNDMVAYEFSALATIPEISTFVLADEHGVIIKSIHYDWVGKNIADVYPYFSAKTFKQVLLEKQEQLITLQHPALIQAYYPVQALRKNGELRSLQYDILVLSYDLSQPLAQLHYDTWTEGLAFITVSLLLSLLLIVIINRLVTKPVAYLSRQMIQFAKTERPVQIHFTGKGELATLGQAFNQLVTRLTLSKQLLLQQTNLYQTLSQANQMMARAKDARGLLQEACQIIVAHDGFICAQATLTQTDNSIVVSADSSQLEPNPAIQPPVPDNLLDTTPLIINDIHNTTHSLPQLPAAPIQSCAFFPLTQFNKTIGQLALYSDQAHFFGSEIVQLLQDLSLDLSYALEKIKLDELRQKIEYELREREKRLDITLNSIGDAVIVTDSKGRITRMNPVAESLTGWHFSEAKGQPLTHVFHIINAITRRPAQNPVEKVIEHGQIVGLANHTALIAKNETEHQIADSAAPIKDDNGSILGIILVFHDVTEEYQLHQQIQNNADRFQHVHAISGAYVWETDADGRITYISEQCYTIKGYRAEQLIGRKLFEHMPEDKKTQLKDILLNMAKHKQTKFSLRIKNTLPDGRVVWEQIRGGGLFDDKQTLIGLRGAGISITEQVEAEERIKKLAFFDPLTHLPNRRMFLDRLKNAVTAAMRHHKFGAILFIDLDHFKNLNDSLGHDIGDELLKQIAQCLRTQLRGEDTAARLGGDEFIILFTELGDTEDNAIAHAHIVTKKIQQALAKEFYLKGHCYHLSLSIGITLFPQPGTEIHDLIKQADTALYRAKDNGRNQYHFFSKEMQEAADQRLTIEKELHSALLQNQLRLYFQPQVNQKQQVIGTEALLRWHHPEKGILSPAAFIDIAEESSLILKIGDWVLKTAFQYRQQWQQNGLLNDQQKLSINISPKQLRQDSFIPTVIKLLEKYQLDGNLFIFEITENVFLYDLDAIIDKINHLKDYGICFSIDDFGTGYSSLVYLKLLPIWELKIDRNFVKDIGHDTNDQAIIETIIAMAKHMQLQVIAEGVETDLQLSFLHQHGCFHYQGYYFSKPLPQNDFEDFVRQSRNV